jgi:hypothetical protein
MTPEKEKGESLKPSGVAIEGDYCARCATLRQMPSTSRISIRGSCSLALRWLGYLMFLASKI